MAGVEGQRIRDTFARRGLSGRTFGAAYQPVPLAYGVLPVTRLIFGIDFAGVSRLPANSGDGDRLKAKVRHRLAPLGLGGGMSWRSVDRQRKVSVGGEVSG
jgi:hypothetical protein